LVSGIGVQGVSLGSLPAGIAELCRREVSAVQLGVDATVHGDRNLALQSLLLSPCITDLDVAEQILDDYLETYREYLPQFW
jgi:alpha-galactosidase